MSTRQDRPRWLLAAVIGTGLAVMATGCGGGQEPTDAAGSVPGVAASPQPTPTNAGASDGVLREGDEPRDPSGVSRSEAEAAALTAVGSGRVTWSGREDDRGAAWEIEVTRPDGSEIDVLVAADGAIITQVDKLGQGAAQTGPGQPPANGRVVSRAEAERAALDAVGEGQVTWSGREDDRGAAWEVEVTRPDGSEVDVLVAADGTVVN
jgi:uncharacterized membrane protein YkoI